MSSTEFSVATLTDEQALEIAQAYIKGDKDPLRMARILGVDQFDLNLVMHPLTRGHVVRLQRALQAEYSLQEHQEQLKKIRIAAFDDENWKVALAAETQLGKAAGHYDPKPAGEDLPPGQLLDPTKMSTEALRRHIASSVGAVIPQEKAIAPPEPGSLESQEADEI